MNPDYLNIIFLMVSLLVNILLQVGTSRCLPKIGLLNSIFLGFFAGVISLFALEFYIFSAYSGLLKDFIADILINLLTYAALGYCYFHFINLGETARRIRIVRELFEAREGLSLDEILKRYSAEEIINRRFVRLIETNQVILKDNKYFIYGSIVLWMAKILAFFKRRLLNKKTELN